MSTVTITKTVTLDLNGFELCYDSTTGDAILVINGGHLYNYNTSAIRQFCNSTTYKNSVTVNGGLVEGYCAIRVQNPGSKTVNGSLSITGGEVRTTAKAYVNGSSALKDVTSAIYCTIAGNGGAWSSDSLVSITGGIVKVLYELDKRSEQCPYILCHTESKCTMFVPLKRSIKEKVKEFLTVKKSCDL